MLGKIEGRRRRGCQRTRWLDSITDEQELGQTPGDGEGQGGLACYSPWGREESDTTERLNNNNSVWDINIMSLLKSAQLCLLYVHGPSLPL